MRTTILCSFGECGRKPHARGWCVSHYGQFSRGEDLRPIRSRRTPTGTKRSNQDVRLWGTYRLTLEAYEALAKDGCALCGSQEDLVVDHDHTCCPGKRSCGKCVRGVLCRIHNVWIGMVNDDPDFLDKAASYLRKVTLQ